jgi:hypothetical protein
MHTSSPIAVALADSSYGSKELTKLYAAVLYLAESAIRFQ